jgi:hypothetical protein
MVQLPQLVLHQQPVTLLLQSLCLRLCRHLHLLATRRHLIMVRASQRRLDRLLQPQPDQAAAAAAAAASRGLAGGVLALLWYLPWWGMCMEAA